MISVRGEAITPARRQEGTLAPLVDVGLLGRHQIAAAIATGIDFGSMIALVELARLSPSVATILSAIAGCMVNFAISRRWAFHARHAGTLRSQALRYGAVSLGGALVNASALAVVLRAIALPYPLARAGISIAASLLYTYPLHTRFVFRVARCRADLPRGA
jgi:putative flippase GtrA